MSQKFKNEVDILALRKLVRSKNFFEKGVYRENLRLFCAVLLKSAFFSTLRALGFD